MSNFAGIIFSDMYDGDTNVLAKIRALASVPFCGRFRMVDFMLSSLVNAGVDNVAVITKRNYASLEDHLGRGSYWDLNHRNSGLRLLSPFYKTANNNEVFLARGKLDALRSVKPHIEGMREEYVVLCNGNVIANIDFDCVLDQHIYSGADITAVCAQTGRIGENDLVVSMDGDRITGLTYGAGDPSDSAVSLGVYVMKRTLLLDIIRRADEGDYYSFEKYALIKNTEKLNITGFMHGRFAGIVHTVRDYYDVSMQMLDRSVRDQLFRPDFPIMTRVMDTVPVLYSYNADVENSIIADGCRIDGVVRNSIIFRNVVIETGAVVENSIILQNSVIEGDSMIDHVILDKNVKVTSGKTLRGAPEYPYVLEKGTVI